MALGGTAFADSSDKLNLNINLFGESFHTDQEHSVFFGPVFDLIHRHSFDENISTRLDLAAELFTGSATGILPPDILGQYGPRQDFRVREAVVEAAFWEHAVTFDFGAVNQQVWGNPLLANDYAFLGALQQFRGDTALGTFGLNLEEAIPPSSFSLLETAAQEKTPGFYMAQLTYQLGEDARTNLKLHAGYFDFENLSTAQARQSLFFGNTVTGNSNSAAFFLPYRGVDAGLKTDFALAQHWRTSLDGDVLQNSAAPAGSSQGYLGKLQLKYLGDIHSVAVEGGYFYDQSDTSPAVFSDPTLNSKNHKGYLAGLIFKNDPKKYSVYARWVHSDPLVPQLYASSDNIVILGLEMRYELL